MGFVGRIVERAQRRTMNSIVRARARDVEQLLLFDHLILESLASRRKHFLLRARTNEGSSQGRLFYPGDSLVWVINGGSTPGAARDAIHR